MNRTEFSMFRDGAYRMIAHLNDTKGHDYAGDDDALANFKEASAQLGMTPEQVWGVYAHKHWSAIQTYIREGDVASEPIEGRIHDIILYGFLLLGLVAERREREGAERREAELERRIEDEMLDEEEIEGVTVEVKEPTLWLCEGPSISPHIGQSVIAGQRCRICGATS